MEVLCVCKGIIFSGSPFTVFVHSSRQVLLPRYLVNSLSNLCETYREYSQAPTDDMIRFWRSGSLQAVEVAKASMLTLEHQSPSFLHLWTLFVEKYAFSIDVDHVVCYYRRRPSRRHG